MADIAVTPGQDVFKENIDFVQTTDGKICAIDSCIPVLPGKTTELVVDWVKAKTDNGNAGHNFSHQAALGAA